MVVDEFECACVELIKVAMALNAACQKPFAGELGPASKG